MGQHFLIDGNVVRKIVEAGQVSRGDAIVEIGPGAGALTMALAGCGARVTALELDRGLIRLLQDLFEPYPTVTVIQGDALQVEWPQFTAAHFGEGVPVSLIANLPYNISAPLLYALFEQGFPFSSAVLMFQKEVARRVTAGRGDEEYGGLSALCRYYARSEILFNVSRNVFWPRPAVDSAVVGMRPVPRLLGEGEEKTFWKLVQGVFQQRRKTCVNGLMNLYKWPRQVAEKLLESAAITFNSRPEELSMEQFANLSRIIYNYCKQNQ